MRVCVCVCACVCFFVCFCLFCFGFWRVLVDTNISSCVCVYFGIKKIITNAVNHEINVS